MPILEALRENRMIWRTLLIVLATPTLWAQPGPTTTTVTLSSSSVTTGTAVTVTASVLSSGAAATAGEVVFCNASATRCEGPAILGSAWIIKSGTAAGTATIRRTFGPGTYNINAVFQGTNTYAASTSTSVTLSVSGPLPTTTTLSATGTSGSYSLNATVWAGGTVAPTGSVSFFDATNSNSLLGSVALSSGILTTGFGFASTSGPAATSQNQAIAVGDFNNDGNLDYVVASVNSSGTATVMLGNGSRTFTAQTTTYSAGSYPEGVVVADFNGDGNLDIAFANSANNGVTILLGNGDGTFTTPASLPAVSFASSITVADFNGDGIPDLAVSTNASNYAMTILLGNGDGTFTVGTPVALPSATVNPEGIVAMDFNGDGKMDLAVTSSNTNSPASYVVTILLGNGDGTFALGNSYTTGNDDMALAGGDFNGDGIPDLAVANYYDNTVTILVGNGDGTFSAAAGSPVAVGDGPFAIITGDFNNDGKLDLATANYYANTVTILLGNGDGTFTAAASAPMAGGAPDGIAAGDFNGDGLLDILTANYAMTSESVLLQSTSSTLVTLSGLTIAGTDTIYAEYSGDTNFSASQSTTVALSSILLIPQTINFANPGAQSYGTPLTLSAAASSALPVTFTVVSGPATLSGGTVLTFTATGSVTIQATQAGNSIFAAAAPVSQSFTVNAGAQTITFPNPGTLPEGVAPISLTATASSGLPVTYSVISGPATVSGSTLTVTGTGSIVVEADQAGNADYSPAPPVQITIQVVSAEFTMSQNVSGPTTIAPGQSTTIPLTIYVAAGFTGTISFTCTPPSSMLESSCSASSVQVTSNAPMTAKVIVETAAPHQVSSLLWPKFWPTVPSGLFAAMVLASGERRKKRSKPPLKLVAFMIILLVGLLGCGGNSASTAMKNDPGTPAGSYSLNVVATSGSASYSVTLPVTVN